MTAASITSGAPATLEVRNLRTHFHTRAGVLPAVDDVSFTLERGKILGLVVQDPFKMGYEGMNSMVTKLQGGKPVERMDIPTRILTKENAAEFAQDPQVTGAQ